MHNLYQPNGLFIFMHNHVFYTLIDTGAKYSFMDRDIANTLHIKYTPMQGQILLASAAHKAERIGVTELLTFTPVVSLHDKTWKLPEEAYDFELLDLPHHKYQFIIGA